MAESLFRMLNSKKRITKPKICDSLNNCVVVLMSGWLINDKTGPPTSALVVRHDRRRLWRKLFHLQKFQRC